MAVSDLQLAHTIADEAGALALRYFEAGVVARRKPDGSPVSDADEATEDLVRSILTAERPDDAILGEERGARGSSSRRWIVDAIDGTRQFVAGDPRWSLLIALEIDGEVEIGVSWSPAMEMRRWAKRGSGAWELDGDEMKALQVTATGAGSARLGRLGLDDVDATLGTLGHVKSDGFTNHPAIEVASGGLDASVLLWGGPWDHAAFVPIVEEAGGRFSDRFGGRSLETRSGVFSNGLLHDAVLDALR